MSCLINSALALDCMNAMGGLKTAYFLAGEITSTTVTAGEITAITGTGSFYEFALAKDTAFFAEQINVSNTAGTVFYEGVLTIVLQKMDADKRNQILLLAQNRDLRIAFVDQQDVTWVMGLSRGAVMSASNAATGTAVADLNGYTLSFTAQEPAAAYPILAGDTLGDVVSGITVVAA
ncbi:MAG: hypothetical protein ACO295_03570 [Sediminibacterium sp.]